MSSAEDSKSLTVSPEASSSSSTPEFPVEPHKDAGDEPSSTASLPTPPVPVEISTAPPPDEPSIEPGEDETPALATKPLPKVNAVAREVHVKATGARPGIVAVDRELFTESATTVLVFEKGAVIRLAAAVAPGQLLLLTNEESKREVVAQVMRKRKFRPTECYVELGFAESAPGFWGMEFSAATALLPKDATEVEAAELVASAETTADELGESAPPPSAEEILELKKEVDALRGQLNLPQAPPPTEQLASGPAISDAVPPLPSSVPPAGAASGMDEPAPSVAASAKSSPIESKPQPGRLTAMDPPPLPQSALDYSISLPTRKRSRARGKFTPGFRTGALRLALLVVALIVTMIGAAWYKHWIPWTHPSRKIPVASWSALVTTTGRAGEAEAAVSGPAKAPTGNTALGKETSASPNAASRGSALPNEPEEQPTANRHSDDSSLPLEPASPAAIRGKAAPPASTLKRTSAHAPAVKPAGSVPASATDLPVVPPKLIRSAPAVASLEDLRDFETGGVTIDAIIDAAGEVKSMSVLSGPPSLRRPALEALKNYKYAPATQNGKPVPAHVMVKVQFHFFE